MRWAPARQLGGGRSGTHPPSCEQADMRERRRAAPARARPAGTGAYNLTLTFTPRGRAPRRGRCARGSPAAAPGATAAARPARAPPTQRTGRRRRRRRSRRRRRGARSAPPRPDGRARTRPRGLRASPRPTAGAWPRPARPPAPPAAARPHCRRGRAAHGSALGVCGMHGSRSARMPPAHHQNASRWQCAPMRSPHDIASCRIKKQFKLNLTCWRLAVHCASALRIRNLWAASMSLSCTKST